MSIRDSRQARIDRAKQLIIATPDITKRSLQSRLKTEFGTGLRDSTRRELLQKANTKGVLKARVNSAAFVPHERKILRERLRAGNPSYVAAAINHRAALMAKAKAAGKTKAQFKAMIRKDMKDNGWIVAKKVKIGEKGREAGRRHGQADMYAMLRHFRDKAIDEGEYVPKVKPRAKTDKGNIAVQKERYAEKQTSRFRHQQLELQRQREIGDFRHVNKAAWLAGRKK